MGRRVALLVNPDKPEATAAAKAVAGLVQTYGTLLGTFDATDDAPPELTSDADVLVVFGGDGTLLSQARRFAGQNVPMIGVNMGRLGFLAEFDVAAVQLQAAAVFGDGLLPTYNFTSLRVEIIAPGASRPRYSGLAINEAVITAGPPYSLIQLAMHIDGCDGPTVRGDGVMISTPLGSTAYNLAAGGPILTPDIDAFVITPIAPQSLAFRPVVVGAQSVIEFVMVRVNNAVPGSGTALVLDGQLQERLAKDETVRMTRVVPLLRFVRNPLTNYWQRLLGKMNWAAEPRLASET
jgi:NAD+ kinase